MTPMHKPESGSRARAAFTYLLLFVFLWSNIHPALMPAAAAAGRPARDAALHVPAAQALERLLGETAETLDRAQRKLERRQSAAAERQAIKELRQWLRDLDGHLADEFAGTESKLRGRGLAPHILQRNSDALKSVREAIEALQAKLESIDTAGDDVQAASRVEEARAYLEAQRAPRPNSAFDPVRVPFQIPSTEPKRPRQTPEEFAALTWQRKTELAALGASVGLLAVSAVPPTGPELLEGTEDVRLDAAAEALADELSGSPVEIFNWVRNNIEFVPSFGSIQGSAQTLASRRGNAFDTASLLIALLRAAEIPARYVFGTIEVPAAAARNWIGGVARTEAAMQLLAQGGVPVEAIYDGNQIKALRLEHVWVEALVDFAPGRGGARKGAGDSWLALDASFKQFTETAPLPIGTEVASDAQSLIGQLQASAQIDEGEGRVSGLDVAALQSGLDAYGEQLDGYIASVKPNATIGDVFGMRSITALEAPVLAAGLPYEPVVEGARFAALPDALRFRLRTQLFASALDRSSQLPVLSLERSLPALAGKRLTLSFGAATADDQAVLDSYFPQRHADGTRVQPEELPQEIPGYLVRVAAQLALEGEAPVTGGDFVLGSALALTTALFDPATGQWRQADDTLYAGEYQALVVDGQGIAGSELQALSTRLTATQLKLEAGDEAGLSREDLSGELLRQAALSYFAANDAFAQLFLRVENVAAYR
ncbi:MAG: transglutaminase domain-containing protein, partial [Gammaproteobacteria bacterium]